MELGHQKKILKKVQKPVIFALCLVPFLLLAVGWVTDSLGTNPVETLTHATGEWALRFLLIGLALTPLRKLFSWHWTSLYRRMFGLFAFFYAFLHFSCYLVVDQFFDWNEIWGDIAKRKYITVGFASFVMLIPLALTSTRGMMRRLGKRWFQLHKLVYFIALGGIVHFLWLVKADLLEPLLYLALFIFLMGVRVWFSYQGKFKSP
jgi:sulfoxide reductase heme-binding subunit YedZ